MLHALQPQRGGARSCSALALAECTQACMLHPPTCLCLSTRPGRGPITLGRAPSPRQLPQPCIGPSHGWLQAAPSR